MLQLQALGLDALTVLRSALPLQYNSTCPKYQLIQARVVALRFGLFDLISQSWRWLSVAEARLDEGVPARV